MTTAEIRKARGMLLDRTNELDREIAGLFASDPDGDDLRIAIREKAETRKALQSLEG